MSFAAAVVAPVLVIAGAGLGVIGWRGWHETLRRNRYFGVRTAASMRSEDAFRLANKVAGLPTLVAAVILVVCGALAVRLEGSTLAIVAGIALVGAIGIVVAAGALGHRAAAGLPEPAAPAGCGGCACGGGGCAAAALRA